MSGLLLEVGRDPSAGMVLEDDLVSRHHVRVIPEGGSALVEDLGSLNGTFVNGQEIHAPTRARPGDHVTNILFDRYVVSDLAKVDWNAARDQTAQIQFADHIVACFNQLAADTLAAIIREDDRVHPVQPFAVCVMSSQSAVVGQFRPRLGCVMCV